MFILLGLKFFLSYHRLSNYKDDYEVRDLGFPLTDHKQGVWGPGVLWGRQT